MPTTFDEVMAYHPDNPDVYQEIRDNLGQLLPFVGAGLTAPVYGTWWSTLVALGDKLASPDKRTKLKEMLERGEYLGAAQFLEDERGQVNLERDLVNYFSRGKLEERWSSIKGGALGVLPHLFRCPVLTTNFDEAIETVYERCGLGPLPVLDPTSPGLRNQAVRLRNTPCAFKIHGTVAGDMVDYAKIVFAEAQYDLHYAEDGEVRRALRSFVDARGLLFLGCSLGPDRTMDVLKEAAGPGVVHYAILDCAADERDRRVRELADARIRAIVYEKGKYDSVRVVLEQLLQDTFPDRYRELKAEDAQTPTITPAERRMIERINDVLVQQRRYHPSFRLMRGDAVGGADEELLPLSQPIPNSERIVRLYREEEVVPLAEYFKQSWAAEGQTHLFITGPGGVGKTVALLTFATEPGFLPKDTPAVYIPLYDLSQYANDRADCIERYLESRFAEKELVAKVEELSGRPWSGGPSLILLLDGYNEIPPDRRRHVEAGVRKWAARPGTQIVTTSRVPGLFGVAHTQQLELQGLKGPEVVRYIRTHHPEVPAPEEGSELLRLLETPLLLRLYVDVETFRQRVGDGSLALADSDSAGHLIWNYLHVELYRHAAHAGGAGSAYHEALLLTLPYVCWKMELAHQFRIEDDEFSAYVQEAHAYWQGRGRPASVARARRLLTEGASDVAESSPFEQRLVLEKESGLISKGADGYTLMHQGLRDGLAAVHLQSAMEAAEQGEVPEAFEASISEHVKDFLADLADEGSLLRLWESNRRRHPSAAVVMHNLARTLYRKRDGDLTLLDWSGMDLRGESLFPYRKGMRLRVSQNPMHFCDTRLDVDSFMPPGHTRWVNDVCFSPDGALLASASDDGTVRLWDAAMERQVRVLEGHTGHVTSLCFSPYGTLLASGSDDGTIWLWDAATGRLVRSFGGRWLGYVTVSFSPEGSCVASGTSDGIVRLWDVATGRCVRELGEGEGRIGSLRFSPDGTLLASGSHTGVVRVWDVATGLTALSFERGGRADSVCFSPDGTLLASGASDGTVQLWDVVSGELARALEEHVSAVYTLCFSPDGAVIAGGFADGSAWLWDAATGERVRVIEGHTVGVKAVCFSPDGTLLASGSIDRAVRLWDSATGRLVRSLEEQTGWVRSTCLSHDGKLLAGGSDDHAVRLWDVEKGQLVGLLVGHEDAVRSVCLSPDGSLLASGSDDCSVRLWDVATGRLARVLEGRGGQARSVCFSPDGTRVACGGNDCTVRVWDATTGQLASVLEGHRDTVLAVCFSPDGTCLASASRDGTVRLWDVETGTLVRTLERYGSPIESVCFSPDGTKLAGGTDNGAVPLWNLATGRMEHEPGGHWSGVSTVCFSPDGTLLASGSEMGSALLWSVETGRHIRTILQNYNRRIVSISFGEACVWIVSLAGGTVCLTTCKSELLRVPVVGSIASIVGELLPLTMEVLPGIDLMGLDFSRADVSHRDRRILAQNGVRV